jgi:phospholipase C
VVVIVQENRNPDNLFGSNPSFEAGVDIATSGINSKGQQIPLGPVPLASCYDLGHVHSLFLKQYDGGKMDGADKVKVLINPGCQVPENPQFKYVDNSTEQIQPYFDIATQYGWANRMFQTNQGGSYPAHQFVFSGTSAPTTNSDLFAAENPIKSPGAPTGCIAATGQTVTMIDPTGKEGYAQYPCFEHPTLSDLLEDAQSGPIDWRYYTLSPGSIWTAPNSIQHICEPQIVNGELVCAGPDWIEHVIIPQTTILTDTKNCNLPPVSWVMPGGADSDHAGSNKGTGPAWVASIVNAIGLSKCGYWQNTAIFITWDDWGGWYEHVPPYSIGQQNGWGVSYTYGFRVPLLVVSAYTPAGYVDNSNYDFGSFLRFIETVFGPPGDPLGPIGPGDYADSLP